MSLTHHDTRYLTHTQMRTWLQAAHRLGFEPRWAPESRSLTNHPMLSSSMLSHPHLPRLHFMHFHSSPHPPHCPSLLSLLPGGHQQGAVPVPWTWGGGADTAEASLIRARLLEVQLSGGAWREGQG